MVADKRNHNELVRGKVSLQGTITSVQLMEWKFAIRLPNNKNQKYWEKEDLGKKMASMNPKERHIDTSLRNPRL